MSSPNHLIRIDLDVHSINCPGVWLCQSGDVELTISCLDYKFRTLPMPPRFPLFYHEQYLMEGFFNGVNNCFSIEKLLATENIEIILWQNSRRLAYYIGKIRDILHWEHCNETFAKNVHNEIIMTPSKCFPGLIAPKLEITVQICIKEKCSNCRMILASEKNSSNKVLRHNDACDNRRIQSCSNCSQSKQSISNKNSVMHQRNNNCRQRSVCHSRSNQKSSNNSNFHPIQCSYFSKSNCLSDIDSRTVSSLGYFSDVKNSKNVCGYELRDLKKPTSEFQRHYHCKTMEKEFHDKNRCPLNVNEIRSFKNNRKLSASSNSTSLSSNCYNCSDGTIFSSYFSELFHSNDCNVCQKYRQFFNI